MDAALAAQERRKPGPKPGARLASAAASTTDAAPAAQGPARIDPLAKGRRIEDMPEAELRAYARQIGVRPRDAAELSVDKLRSNCVLHLMALLED